MQRRCFTARHRLAAALILLMCIAWLFSGTFLAVYADHACQHECCKICPVLARCMEILAPVAIVGGAALSAHRFCATFHRHIPAFSDLASFTPVHRKIKLTC